MKTIVKKLDTLGLLLKNLDPTRNNPIESLEESINICDV